MVITGVGRSFCAGADLGCMDSTVPGGPGQRMADVIETLSNRLIEDLCTYSFLLAAPQRDERRDSTRCCPSAVVNY